MAEFQSRPGIPSVRAQVQCARVCELYSVLTYDVTMIWEKKGKSFPKPDKMVMVVCGDFDVDSYQTRPDQYFEDTPGKYRA